MFLCFGLAGCAFLAAFGFGFFTAGFGWDLVFEKLKHHRGLSHETCPHVVANLLIVLVVLSTRCFSLLIANDTADDAVVVIDASFVAAVVCGGVGRCLYSYLFCMAPQPLPQHPPPLIVLPLVLLCLRNISTLPSS